jgi:membrane fusion protein (multidrug efflux system)
MNKSRKWGRSIIWMMVFMVVFIGGGTVAVRTYLTSLRQKWTDDAFLQSTVTRINPQVAGRVAHVYVNDNQPVSAGDLLVKIDPSPLEAELAKVRATAELARTKLESAKLNVGLTRDTTNAAVENAQAQLDAAEAAVQEAAASVEAAESDAARLAEDAKRYEGLLKQNIVSAQQRDAAVSARDVAAARVSEARRRLTAAQSRVQAARAQLTQAQTAPQQVAVTEAQTRQYEAEVAQAEASARRIELDLSYTKIHAPADGTITNKAVHDGEYVVIGQGLMSLVQNDLYVEANFKETQLTYMRPGQRAEVEVDAFPGRTFKAHVDSIQSGTGAEFSLLPPQNATGNYVKVVQRVPVKIVFDEPLPEDLPLVSGMSVVPTVHVQ